MSCIFCEQLKPEQILFETNSFCGVFDIDPVQSGHLLLISKEHYENITELPQETLYELIQLEQQTAALIEENFDVLGVTIVQNNGEVMDDGTHFHVHVIPRYREDDFWAHQLIQQHPIDQIQLKEFLKKLAS